MPGTLGVTIGEKHTLKDWNLGWTAITLGFPEPKTYEQDVPGADGTLDITEAVTGGDVKYKNRSLSLEFETPDEDFFEWGSIVSDIANYLVGKKMKIILDTDPSFYYIGRLTIDVEKTDRINGKLVMSGEVDPYKYEVASPLEDWLWDDFNFETDIIREYGGIKVSGKYELNIYGRRKRVIPVIECDTPMQVTYNRATYDLPKGKSKVFDIWLSEGDNLLTFTGNGTVSVDYRGGSL